MGNERLPGTISDYAKYLNQSEAENKKLKDTLKVVIDNTLEILFDLKKLNIENANIKKLGKALKRIQGEI